MKKDKKTNASLIKDYPVTDERKTFQNMVDNQNPIIKSTAAPEVKKAVKTSLHVKYPQEFLRFDDGFANNPTEIIYNKKILEDLRSHSRKLKMLWESYSWSLDFHHEVISKTTSKKESSECEANKINYYCEIYFHPPEDVLISLMSSIAYYKILTKNSSLHSNRSSINDKNLIIRYCRESLEKLKKSQIQINSKWTHGGFHPFYRIASEFDYSGVFEQISKPEYKKYEQNFIRTSNLEKQILKEEFKKVLTSKKKIIIMRLDVLERDFLPPSYFNSDKYRSDLNHAVERILAISGNNLILASNVIFPRNFITNKYFTHRKIIGHLILVFNFNSFDKNGIYEYIAGLPNFENDDSDITFVNVEAGGPSFKSIGTGLLKSTNPSDFNALDDIAEFMTLERRLINPSASLLSSTGILGTKPVGHKVLGLEKF